jgi:uncharacterized protein
MTSDLRGADRSLRLNAIITPMRPQKSPPARLQRWLRLILLLPTAAYAGIILAGALLMTLAITVPLKSKVCCLDLPHADITFQTADGLTLSGWYVPPQNGATIILLHAYYGDRRQTLPMAEMLAKHGYGLLLYDQRASGESQGNLRSLGWRDIPDVSAAAQWLKSRPETGKIGLLGCSMGGAIALAAAADYPAIEAVAADAPSPLTFSEARPRAGDPNWGVSLPIYALYYGLTGLVNGTFAPTSTLAALPKIAPRPLLLISTGQDGEIERVKAYYELARQPKTHWNIPNSSHCAGPVTNPIEYEQQLVEFFDTALLEK